MGVFFFTIYVFSMKRIVALAALAFAFAVRAFPASAESGVVVTEVMANPLAEDSDEFIELYNPGLAPVDLSGWSLTDGDALDTFTGWDPVAHGVLKDADAFTGSLVLAPGAFAVVLDAEYASGSQEYDLPAKTLVVTVANTTIGNGLTTNDALTVYDSAKVVASTYGTPVLTPDWHDADDDTKDGIPFDPGNGVSVERKDVSLGDVESNWEASESVTGSTPGASRFPPQEPEAPEDNPDENDGNDSGTPPTNPPNVPPSSPPASPPADTPDGEGPPPDSPDADAPTAYSDDVHVSELLPNPEGSDEQEFIELWNDSDETISLVGWKLSDASRSYTIDEAEIAPRGFLVFDREVTGLALNNSGSETVELRDPADTVKSSVEYSGAKEGQSYSLVDDGWVWSETPTPGKKNVFEEANSDPVAVIDASPSGRTFQKIRFDAGDSADPDTDDELAYSWDFGDGETCDEALCEHEFDSERIYSVSLRVTDTRGAEDEAEHTIEIHAVDASADIRLSEVMVNPEGPDETGEWIELANTGASDVNLFGWIITDEKVSFTIEEEITVRAHAYLAFDRSSTGITLNNSSEHLYLIDPLGKIREGVEIVGGKQDQSFAKSGDGKLWRWTTTPTKGDVNQLTEVSGEKESEKDDTADQTQRAVTSSRTSSSSATVKGATAVSTIAAVRDLPKGSAVTFQGIVTASPGDISSDFFFVQDDTGGVQVYSSSAAFPAASAGDLVEITGKISKSAQEFRVNVSTEDGMKILGNGEEMIPKSVTTLEDHDGELVTVNGEIASKRSTSWNVLADDGEEIAMKFLSSGAVVPPSAVAGQRVSATGIVRVKKGVAELLPRRSEDLVIEQLSGEVLGVADTTEDTMNESAEGEVMSPQTSFASSSPLLPLLAAGYVIPLGALMYMYKIRVRQEK